jgi:thymidylate synthase
MKQYLDLLRRIRDTGTRQANRTGIDSIFVPGAMMQFDLREGFPAVTTKKLFFKKTIGENIGFLQGKDNAADFRALGCDIWDGNANRDGVDLAGNVVPNLWLTNKNRKGEDDLGRIYGVQWRHWRGKPILKESTPVFSDAKNMHFLAEMDFIEVDQVQNILAKLKTNPTDRRMIINAWRPDEFDQMALPPCHIMYQFIANVEKNELHLCMYQRSCDMFLGVPFNIAGSSILLTVIAALTGFQPATFTHFLADAHIYVNHLEQIELQLSREPKQAPVLAYTGPGSEEWNSENEIPLYSSDGIICASVFDELKPEHFNLLDYDPHPAIKADMAV